jgi:hypothetical protein
MGHGFTQIFADLLGGSGFDSAEPFGLELRVERLLAGRPR